MLIPTISYVFLQNYNIQNKIIQYLTTSLSKTLGTTVKIKKVSIDFFYRLTLEDLFIADQRHDTLLYVQNFKTGIQSLIFLKHKIMFNKIKLTNAFINLYDSVNILNYEFIIDKLFKPDTIDTLSSKWQISFKNIEIKNSRFVYVSDKYKKQEYGINFDSVSLHSLNIKLNNIHSKHDTLYFTINTISCVEKSGFKLQQLSSRSKIAKGIIQFNNLVIKAPQTQLNANRFSMKYNSGKDFKYFTSTIKMEGDFTESKIHSNDLSYFAPELNNFNQWVYFSGYAKGTVKNIKGKDIRIQFGEKSTYYGNVDITGLPKLKETFFYFDIKQLITHKNDIEKLKTQPFNNNKFIKLPHEFSKLNLISFNGKITGVLNNMVAYGRFSTGLGIISSDILIKNDTMQDKISFKGKLATTNFNLGTFLDNSDLNTITLNAQIDGIKPRNEALEATFNGNIESIEYKKYSYKNIEISGLFSKNNFTGSLNIHDPNLELTFLGKIDFSQKQRFFDFTINIAHANPNKLNIITDSMPLVSMLATAKFNGSSIDNTTGSLVIKNLSYQNYNSTFFINNLTINATINGQDKELSVFSDVLDARLKGNYNITSIITSLKKVAHHYLPSFVTISESQKTQPNNDISFEIALKNTQPISKTFIPFIEFAPNTKISGSLNDIASLFTININSSFINIYKTKLKKIQIQSNTFSKPTIIIKSDTILFDNNIVLQNFETNSTIFLDSISNKIIWDDKQKSGYKGTIEIIASSDKTSNDTTPVLNIHILPSIFTIKDTVWHIEKSQIVYEKKHFEIVNLLLFNHEQNIMMNGKISENTNDSLIIQFNSFNLINVSMFTKQHNVDITGKLNGQFTASSILYSPIFSSKLTIDSLIVNNAKLGSAWLNSTWENNHKRIRLEVFTKRGEIKTLYANGSYYPETEKINFDIFLDKLWLNFFQPFFTGYASNIVGLASGNFKLTGTFKKPQLEGKVKLMKAFATIDYLKTRYGFTNDNIKITHEGIYFNNFVLTDSPLNNESIINGKISHTFFSDYKFNLTINSKNFLILNTTEKDNSLYYGKGYITGVTKIKGTPEMVSIDISAKAEKNTQLFIPLNSTEEVAQSNFIKFINKTSPEQPPLVETKSDITGIEMDCNLELTSESEIQLVFDTKMGDIMKGRGNGNIRMKITQQGNFFMYGDYVIERGEYLFTLRNILNKKFELEKGGRISWNGDPYDATIDILAKYKLKASLFDLVLDTNEIYKKRIPVECQLFLTGKIHKPDVRFGIDLPDAEEQLKSEIKKLTDDEINKQLLSLLVINRFYTPEHLRGQLSETRSSRYGVGANTGEILSNQLNYWLSQISHDFDIGVNYRPGDELSKDEVEVALSTQLFNDRVSINGNVGIGGNHETTSNIVGDVMVNVKINKTGNLSVKGYNKTNHDIVYDSSPYTQGVGLFYKEEFNTFGELLRKYWSIFKRKKIN